MSNSDRRATKGVLWFLGFFGVFLLINIFRGIGTQVFSGALIIFLIGAAIIAGIGWLALRKK